MSYDPFSFDALDPFKKENFHNPISPHFGKPLTLLFGESDDEKEVSHNYKKKNKKYDEEELNENE